MGIQSDSTLTMVRFGAQVDTVHNKTIDGMK